MIKNIAVVGCGHWGKNLVRNFAELGSLKAICDPEESVAERFAKKFKVTANNVAAAWTISHPFSSFALIGPRIIEELDSSLKNLEIELTEEHINWLNLIK